jgi:hypothetical protein
MLKDVQNNCQVNHHGLHGAGVAIFIKYSISHLYYACFETAFEKEAFFKGTEHRHIVCWSYS